MSEPPKLPETDDPFELLQIELPATEREVKRAYVRLIKRFRPERNAAAFMRVQAAYEDALARIRWKRNDDDWGKRDDVGRGADQETDANVVDAAESAAPWMRAASEALGRGDSSEAIDMLAAALRENTAGVAEFAVQRLDFGQLCRLVVRPEATWDHLREQDNRWAAFDLLSLRFDELSMRNEARVLSELDEPSFRRDLVSSPPLEQLAFELILRAAWEGDERARRLFNELGRNIALSMVSTRYLIEEALGLAGSWRRFKSVSACPVALERFVFLFGSVGVHHKQLLLARMDAELSRDPMRLMSVLDALDRFDPRLLGYVFELVSEVSYEEDKPVGELAEKRREQIERALRGVDLNVRSGTHIRRTAILTGLGATAAFFALPAGFGLLGAVGIIAGVSFWQLLPEDGSYYRNTRPALCRIVAETGIEPKEILEWITKHSSRRNRFRLELSIEGDLPLATFGRLSRLCLAWRGEQLGRGRADE